MKKTTIPLKRVLGIVLFVLIIFAIVGIIVYISNKASEANALAAGKTNVTDTSLITELRGLTFDAPVLNKKITLKAGYYESDDHHAFKLGDIAMEHTSISAKRNDIIAVADILNGDAGLMMYLLQFTRQADGSIVFVSAVPIDRIAEVASMQALDIPDKDAGQEYSVILKIPPAKAAASSASSSSQIVTARTYTATVINGKLAEDSIEIY